MAQISDKIKRIFKKEDWLMKESLKRTMKRHRKIMRAIESVKKGRTAGKAKAFFTTKELNKIYSDFMEYDQETVSADTTTSYLALQDAFDSYLNEFQSDLFRQAFEYGYIKAIENSCKVVAADAKQ